MIREIAEKPKFEICSACDLYARRGKAKAQRAADSSICELDDTTANTPTDSDTETQMEVVACEELSPAELLAAAAPHKPAGRPGVLA